VHLGRHAAGVAAWFGETLADTTAFDLAQAAGGDARPAPRRSGRRATDRGRPRWGPRTAVHGFLLPPGGHKGYGLALMADLLAGVLSGASHLIAALRALAGERER
jgi:hypothetical protein